MKQFQLEKPNIFMRFYFNEDKEDKQIMFLYSDTNGLKHLERVLEESSLFFNLLTPVEIFTKMSYEMVMLFNNNNQLELPSSRWSGKLILPSSDEYDFNVEFAKWKKQLEGLIGKNNLFTVMIPEKEFDEHAKLIKNEPMNTRDQATFNYIENYRLRLELEGTLEEHPAFKKKPKL